MNIALVLCIAVLVVGVIVVMKRQQASRPFETSFDRQEYLFSPAERSFLGVLAQALEGRYRVYGKVRLGDIIKPGKGLSRSSRTSALNKINLKHVDFVVCSPSDYAVVGVVELDDQSHGKADHAGRDEFVDRALASARIPIARFSAKKGYVVQDVRVQLAAAFGTPHEVPEAEGGEAEPSPGADLVSTTEDQQPVSLEEVAPSCPKCNATMVKRQAKQGPHAGKYFWACSGYPKCRQVVAIEVD